MKNFYLFALFFSTQSFAQTDSLLTPAQIHQDLDSLYFHLFSNHPKLFVQIEKTTADSKFLKIKKAVINPLSRKDFLKLTSTFVTIFRDGHTFMDVNFEDRDFENYVQKGGLFFPLEVVIINYKLYNVSPGKKILVGDEITSINDIPVQLLLPELISLMSADSEQTAFITLQRLFGYALWLHGLHSNNYQIEHQSSNEIIKLEIEGISKKELLSITFNSNKPVRQMHLYPQHSLAVVEINSYSNVEKSKKFIDSCFTVIKSLDIQHVALDLRRNGGGNSYIGDYFLAHLSPKPYSTIKRKSWRIGPLINNLEKDHWMFKSISNNETSYKREGEYLHSPVFEPQLPVKLNDSAVTVESKLYLLTSQRTYSSAHMTALAVKCGELGIIIGQPTGERLNLTGEILEYRLTHSKLVAVIPTASYVTACGDGNQVGVQPDYFIQPDIKNIKEGIDAELEFLITLISKQ